MNTDFTYKPSRFIEILPAFLIWFTFGAVVILSLVRPLWAIYFIIIFVIYWVVRLFYMMVWLVISWVCYRRDIKVDWLKKVQGLDKNYLDYYHLIFYPTYKEPYEVIARSLNKLLATSYPKDKMIVALGGEGKDEANFSLITERIKSEFGDKFFKLLVTVHRLTEGELPGKGSNVHFMEENAKRVIDELGLPYERVIASCFDIETLPHRQYFACLTFHYLTHPRPTQASYQPLILYNNNLWQSNPIVRVVASATTFWLLTDLSRPERLLTFSSHSMSFKMIVDVGFHDSTIVSEDSRICLQGLVHYNGDYEVVPLFVTLSMDTVQVGSFGKSLIDQYKQMRRWAWGVEHLPWLWDKFFGRGKNPRLPLRKKCRYFFNQLEGMYSWAVAPLLILVFGRLPLWLASDQDKALAFFQNAPYTLEKLMMVGMVGLILNSIMYTFMLPTRPAGYHWFNYLIMVAQWLLFPVTMIIFGSIPAIDSQTRLFLGGRWRLGFWVTEKKV